MSIEPKLPDGWHSATVDEMIGKNGLFVDGDWVESKDQNPNGSVRLIQLADIGITDFKDKSSRFMTIEKAKKLNCTFLQKDDVLIARMPNPLGRSCLFPEQDQPCVTVVDVAIVRPEIKRIDSKWLMYIVNSPIIQNQISKLQSGTTRKRISRKNLSKIVFDVPPLKEQKRIISKIESIFSRIDAARKSLDGIKVLLKQNRQSVLKSAFEGKLIPFDSKRWKKTKLDDVCEKITDGEHMKPKFIKQGIPFLTAKNIQNYGVVFDNIDFVSKTDAKKFLKRCNPQKNDILLVSRGATVGRLCIVNTTTEFCLLGSVILIKTIDSIISKFLFYFLKSPLQQRVLTKISGSTAQQAIYLRDIKEIMINLPPLNEQKRIVEKIELLFGRIDAIEKRYELKCAYRFMCKIYDTFNTFYMYVTS